jgi:Icc-related predicted phosphoesterase
MIDVDGIAILGINKGPEYFDWKFSFAKAEGEQIIEKYKEKVDILITHWPPFGILDEINKK